MLDVERNVSNLEIQGSSDMQLLSRNVFTKLASNAAQISRLTTLNALSTKHLLNRPSAAITTNLCSAQARKFSQKSTDQENELKENPQNLPHFPVPPLRETLEKFMKSAQVHLTEKELDETKRVVEDFQNGIGKTLQGMLEDVAQKERNWLATRWLNAAYLTYRDPVTVFSSPGMAFPTQKFSSNDEYIDYAAQITYAALAYKSLIDNNKLAVEKMGKQELDMSQYKKIFGTTRIPNKNADLHKYSPKSRHIVVVHKNHFFKMAVYKQDGEIIGPEAFKKMFKCILESNEPPALPVGILTTDGRDAWASAYQEIKQDFQNKRALDDIHKALFLVCLDQEVPVVHGDNDMVVVSEQLIHGGGPYQNAGNRWMDKTIQIVINRNGVNGLCYEHSPAEGQPIAIMTDFILSCVESGKLKQSSKDTEDYDSGYRLPFNISDNVKRFIDNASARVEKLATDLHMEVLHYKSYGKEFIKSQKLSPDSYLQMAMQYAFFKLHKQPAAQYESAHLRMFVDGRTETIRTCSTESMSWVCSMVSECSQQERIERLRKAVNGHRDYTMMALQGKGVDRHLLGLKLMALENKLPVPDLFRTPGFQKSAHFRMSTSQVSSKYLAFMCYGPLVDNGYGCCYNPRANDMLFAISSWRSNSETNSSAFKCAMKEALDSMHELLSCAGEVPKSKL